MTSNEETDRMNDFLSHIDQIQESSSWHVLDFIPFQPKNPDFLHYEQFLETGNYVQDFARRICFISLTLIAEYEAKLYLTENETFFKLHPDLKPLHNIRELPYQKLDEIIKEVIVNDLSSLQIFSQMKMFY
ncbi:hypothetical protein [Arcanobacterium hippocoleae]|uniref:hypothetical protein n=1 Tax=Arcanobacterium hippocoleae TaxID=149017 RepID=UPI003340E04C